MGRREGLAWATAAAAHQRLTTPWDVEHSAVETIRAWHTTHLSSYERALGFQPRTLAGFKTVDHINGSDGLQAGMVPPACVFYITGTQSAPEPTELERLDVVWALAMVVRVAAVGHLDAVRRRDALTWTAIESLLCHPAGPVTDLRLMDVENLEAPDGATRYMAESRTMLAATTPLAVHTRYGLGDQPPADPYADPATDPVIRRIDQELRKEEITAW